MHQSSIVCTWKAITSLFLDWHSYNEAVCHKLVLTNLLPYRKCLSSTTHLSKCYYQGPIAFFSGVCVIFSCYCCVLDADALTGFSNPNYSLNHDDTLNSNRLPPTPHPYNLSSPTPGSFSLPPTLHDNGTTTTSDTSSVTSNGTRKNRSKYADTHLRDMGVAPDVTMVTSPVESEGHFSMQSSAVASPDETQDDVTSNGDATMTSSKNDVRVQQSISTQRLLQWVHYSLWPIFDHFQVVFFSAQCNVYWVRISLLLFGFVQSMHDPCHPKTCTHHSFSS